eukprot:764034-Hanusia_phi.AAC.3
MSPYLTLPLYPSFNFDPLYTPPHPHQFIPTPLPHHSDSGTRYQDPYKLLEKLRSPPGGYNTTPSAPTPGLAADKLMTHPRMSQPEAWSMEGDGPRAEPGECRYGGGGDSHCTGVGI